MSGRLMASCVRNNCAKNYQNLVIDFQVTVKNVGDVFLGHSIADTSSNCVTKAACRPAYTVYPVVTLHDAMWRLIWNRDVWV